MALKNDVTFLEFMILVLKILVAAFLLKAVLSIVGFTGYIPVLDEVYNFVMKAMFSLGGNPNLLPSNKL